MQGVHNDDDVAACVDAYVPGAQIKHVEIDRAPTDDEDVPGGQGVQLILPVAFEKYPGAQGVSMLDPFKATTYPIFAGIGSVVFVVGQ
jgi:hypothetical protein